MQLLHHLLGIFAGHQEAQVMAGCAVTNHANVERFQYAEYLFANAAAFDRSLPINATSARPSSTSTRHSAESSISRDCVSNVSPVEVEPVVSRVNATLTSDVVIKSTEILCRARMPKIRETARMQHIQAVQSEQSLIATKRQRAEQRRIFSFIAHQRTTCAWVFAGADKDRDIAAYCG